MQQLTTHARLAAVYQYAAATIIPGSGTMPASSSSICSHVTAVHLQLAAHVMLPGHMERTLCLRQAATYSFGRVWHENLLTNNAAGTAAQT